LKLISSIEKAILTGELNILSTFRKLIYHSMKSRIIAIAWGLAFTGLIMAQSVSKFIIVDQFGYLPLSQKIAVIKDPQVGFDAGESFTPGQHYVVVNAITGKEIYSGVPAAWNSGATDVSSGDKVWHFDFSGVTDIGRYYIVDKDQNLRSFEFDISPLVYKDVLKQAMRSFFYQRSGFPKDARYAGAGWADGASHIGPLQDKNCRLFSDKDNPATELDLHGGWYDAGDYNKYTNWTANYIVEMMKAYLEKPTAWADNYNIPESGNGIPDLLDEAKWGIDFLLRMQRPDGSVLCIVGESHASPPSSATGQSLYGPATTSASLNTAAAFALSSKVYRAMNMVPYADTLLARAHKAWDWAQANPAVIFNNNSAENSSLGVGAGNQEEDDYTRSMSKLEAACFLFDATQDPVFRDYFDTTYQLAHLIAWTYAYPYEPIVQDLLLYYTRMAGASAAVTGQIRNTYRDAMENNADNFPAYYSAKDPYMAHLAAYTWGSNGQKGAEGSMFCNMIYFSIDQAKNQDALNAAMGYIHYIHGVNPLNMVYLSNMYQHGGENCVNEFYHSWFCNGSARWDRVGTSLYGPPPGYLTGGANPGYNWAGCCPGGCGSTENNAACLAESISPPKNQPKQKSYKDFNTSWPLDSWEITENSCGYQVNYIRLLSKFVDANVDCHGDSAGTATPDTCGICSGGNTGKTAIGNHCDCPTSQINTTVLPDGNTLMAQASGATFQWLQCNDGYRMISDATGAGFLPVSSGSYAVEVRHQDCSDTSACFEVNIADGVYNFPGDGLSLFPNPTGGQITINLPDLYEEVHIDLTGPDGQLVMQKDYTGTQSIRLSLDAAPGLYMLTIRNNRNEKAVVKLIMKN
jgi:endoglucanase